LRFSNKVRIRMPTARPLRGARPLLLLLTGSALAALGYAATPNTPTDARADASLFGFTREDSATQRSLEERFDGAINAQELSDWLKKYSSEANHVGSPHDKANAEQTLALFKQWGWDAHIEEFQALYPTLKSHTLELTAPTHFVAKLNEPAIAGDPTTARKDALPPYNEYGGDGDVRGELVYANYGMPEDYKELARRGIDVKGRIVITRYGRGWRGLKPKLAQEHGAIGCIIYSDPREDGYSQGDVYPKGAWRPADGVQRGSVEDMTQYPGDPLTPGVGATKDAKRLPLSEAKTVLKIPVLPISYADAQPLLAALGGPVAPGSWRGSLPITYHIGAGPAKVHLAIASDWNLQPLYDVIARIDGSQHPEEWVVRGNHRDGWVYGATDPLSGHVDLMAEAQAIGGLLKNGWRPKRTLIYASWDGEEPGLLGSTEWAEEHAAELKEHAVLYLNSDSNMRGFLSASGSHSLQHLVNDVATGVKDPETGVSVQARARARLLVAGFEGGAFDDEKKEARKAAAGGDLAIGALGSGSDYTPFLQHLGIASLNIEYAGEGDMGGVYHSSYDTYEHYVRFGDPGFQYGVAEAETIGHIVLRMAEAPVLPLQLSGLAETIDGYVQEVHKLADDQRRHAEELGRLLDSNAFGLAADPTQKIGPPEREAEVPFLNLAPLDNAVARLKRVTHSYDELHARWQAGGVKLTDAKLAELNGLLAGLEHALTDEKGLPSRDWFKHMIYAPGRLTGYGVKTLPGVREAIEQSRWDEAVQYAGITATSLEAYCDRVERASKLLKGE
jgi:N-acetylated-alpha-linked acidic dipeptidase